MTSNIYRDTTLLPSKARHLQAVWDARVRALARKTPVFDEYQLQALYLIFHKLCETHEWWGSALGKSRSDRLDRAGFLDACSTLLDIQDDAALDALFSALDPDNRRYLTAPRWVRGLVAMQGSDTERAQLCWRALTSRREAQVLTRSDISTYAKAMFVDAGIDNFDGFCKVRTGASHRVDPLVGARQLGNPSHSRPSLAAAAQEFVDAMLRGTKAGKEGVLPLEEYLEIVSKRPLMTELALTLLPERAALDAFLATFCPQPRQPRTRKVGLNSTLSRSGESRHTPVSPLSDS
ncbi:EF-hand calcium-binding domain-containing protein 1 [Frankliniella fusca]|uniref:EF-hand calcium-binding domain-containing protein 1 n=1 Tax=Frankliniella fusca TaxID=407009 RepID=A0AAE1LUB2_9NEOP|nr:EF-hand calcium-binding domain-containing protein 1 [Frankliniella fusca]